MNLMWFSLADEARQFGLWSNAEKCRRLLEFDGVSEYWTCQLVRTPTTSRWVGFHLWFINSYSQCHSWRQLADVIQSFLRLLSLLKGKGISFFTSALRRHNPCDAEGNSIGKPRFTWKMIVKMVCGTLGPSLLGCSLVRGTGKSGISGQ